MNLKMKLLFKSGLGWGMMAGSYLALFYLLPLLAVLILLATLSWAILSPFSEKIVSFIKSNCKTDQKEEGDQAEKREAEGPEEDQKGAPSAGLTERDLEIIFLGIGLFVGVIFSITLWSLGLGFAVEELAQIKILILSR